MESPSVILEPRQRAIIAWNGDMERLILSTDVSMISASAARTVVEFIPLPSKASVRPEELDVFERMKNVSPVLMNDSSVFTPSSSIGRISKSQIIEIEKPEELVAALTHHCAIESSYVAPTEKIARDYLDRDYRWFAVETLEPDSLVRSFPPIAYEFASAELYYPLETSTMGSGRTFVDLILVTPTGINSFDSIGVPINVVSSFTTDASLLAQAQPDFPDFFAHGKVTVQHVVLQGDLSEMRVDLLGR